MISRQALFTCIQFINVLFSTFSYSPVRLLAEPIPYYI